MLIYLFFLFCQKLNHIKKYILFYTILIFKEMGNISSGNMFFFFSVFGVISSSFHPPGGRTLSMKRTRILSRTRPHTGHSIHFILYMTMKQGGFEGQQNCTKWDESPASSMAFIRCVWSDETSQQCSCQTQSTYIEVILTSIDTCNLFQSCI